MKKNKILLIALLVMTLGLVTGCGSEEVELGDYIGIKVNVSETVVTDKDVENAIIDLIVEEQEMVNITNRAVRNGDVVNIDYVGKVDGTAFTGGTANGYELEIGSGSFIDNFEDQIIGMKIGETKDIKVTFPDPYKNNPDLAGKEAIFTVKVNSITGKEIPKKITNAMIKKISDTYTTVKEFKTYQRKELEAQAVNLNRLAREEAAWTMVTDNSTVNNLSNKKIKYYSNLYELNYQYYADMYGIELSTFIADYMGITTADFNAEKKLYGENNAISAAVASAIATKQGYSVSDEEYETYITENEVDADSKSKYGEAIRDQLLYDKVIEFILSKAEITVVK